MKKEKQKRFTLLEKDADFNRRPLLFKTNNYIKPLLMRFIKVKNVKISLTGFTLLEIVIVIAIISIIAAISIVSWQSFSDATNLGNTAKMIEMKIKLAKNYSLSALNDVNYGVHLEAGNVTIFPADAAYIFGDSDNQVFNLTDGVEIYNGVGNDIIFSRLTGVTDDAGNIGIRIIKRPSKIKIISINAQGQTGTDTFEASSVSPINNARHVHFNLGWNIENATVLHLVWIDNVTSIPIITNDIDATSYFNVGKTEFDWSGTTVVNGVLQPMKIHSWLDGSGYTVLCVMRDATENEELNIYFTDGIDKDIATYEKNEGTGVINVAAGVYGGIMDIQ